MEKFTLEKDIRVFCVTAKSFPDGIMDAFKKLQALVPGDRKYFGLSRPENGSIVYKAAVEEKEPGEAEKLNCEPFIIRKGNYLSKTITDYMKNTPAIGETFQEMIKQPDIDPNGYCVESYFNEKDVCCMVRLKD
jgi:hypothetical protein